MRLLLFLLALADMPISCARAERSVREPHQANRQQPADSHIKYQTGTRPPTRYPGIVNEHVVHEIKYSVRNQSSHYPPRTRFEPEYGHQQKSDGNHAFDYKRPPGGSHRSKQDIIRGDHDEQDGIERSLPIKASDGGQACDSES